jgi:hypothetical protein
MTVQTSISRTGAAALIDTLSQAEFDAYRATPTALALCREYQNMTPQQHPAANNVAQPSSGNLSPLGSHECHRANLDTGAGHDFPAARQLKVDRGNVSANTAWSAK